MQTDGGELVEDAEFLEGACLAVVNNDLGKPEPRPPNIVVLNGDDSSVSNTASDSLFVDGLDGVHIENSDFQSVGLLKELSGLQSLNTHEPQAMTVMSVPSFT